MIAPVEPSTGRLRASRDVDTTAQEKFQHFETTEHSPSAAVGQLREHLQDLLDRQPVAIVATVAICGLALGWLTKRRGR